MAKFYGAVGFVTTEETALDVHTPTPVEGMYKGDLLSSNRRLDKGLDVNDDIMIGNRISIVADPYATSHFFAIRYVKWAGATWKVANVDVEYPRLILSLGGLYNGETA